MVAVRGEAGAAEGEVGVVVGRCGLAAVVGERTVRWWVCGVVGEARSGRIAVVAVEVGAVSMVRAWRDCSFSFSSCEA